MQTYSTIEVQKSLHVTCRSSSVQPWDAVRAHKISMCACAQRVAASYYPAFPPKVCLAHLFADGFGLDESLAKILRFVFLIKSLA